MNDEAAGQIEIPLLPPALYSMPKMKDWLRTFKASQPATLPLVEAHRRFEELRNTHIERLRELASPIPAKRHGKSTERFKW
ncbi:MAG: hypothetical protein HYR72_03705 [Deltaproteobacteria bacterium]|nr:hypothetical protein [Deltaproteobacteria bacterium]MBI3388706.1 hypothetical protein [Deltaproteobacteria bacterium]